jgi:thiamine biosynthesis lipoprotein
VNGETAGGAARASGGAWSAASFQAMGTGCRIVTPHVDLTTRGVALVAELERTWSRFRPDSEISALNRSAGRLCVVSELTFELIARAEEARRATGGAFNPLVLDHVLALGYDRTWAEVADGPVAPELGPATDRPIELFDDVRGVRLPEGSTFDPGGIGKGLAGDIVAAALLADGATRVQVELGGDVRVAGTPWVGDEWEVRVDDVDHGVPTAAVVRLGDGGVATSSVVRRRWRRGGTLVHHLVDPGTGRPAVTDLDAVTVVAPTLWWAEVVAKVALMAGADGARAVLGRYDMAGLLVPAAPPHRVTVVERSGVAA